MSTPESRRRTVAVAGRTIRALKMAAGCCDCGYRKHPDALQFDHRDPATKRRDLGWRDCRSKLWNLTRLNGIPGTRGHLLRCSLRQLSRHSHHRTAALETTKAGRGDQRRSSPSALLTHPPTPPPRGA